MENKIITNRLSLSPLSIDDVDFIFELVNTPEWKRFIGDRNVNSKEAAVAFVQRIISNPNVNYWVVKKNDENLSLGIVSLVKRDYLEFFDVGFAFLQVHAKQGFAHESTLAFLHHLAKEKFSSTILATTVKENYKSIALLQKLGFQ